MSKHNKKEESIFDKIENMTGIPIMYLAIILAVVIVIIGIGISYMFPLGDSGESGESPPPVNNETNISTEKIESQLSPPITMNGGNVKIFKRR